jgi:hypothetical protein
MDASLKRTVSKVVKLAENGAKPYAAALSEYALLHVQLGIVAQWVANQDESNDPARVVEIARAAVAAIHAKYEQEEVF